MTSTSAANVPRDVCLFLALSTIQRKLCCHHSLEIVAVPIRLFDKFCRGATLGGTGRKDRAAPHPVPRMQTRMLRWLRVHRAQHPHPLHGPRLSAISLEDNDGSGKKNRQKDNTHEAQAHPAVTAYSVVHDSAVSQGTFLGAKEERGCRMIILRELHVPYCTRVQLPVGPWEVLPHSVCENPHQL